VKRGALIAGLAALVVLLFAGSLMAGKAWVPFTAWFSDDPRWWIVAELRLPRAILGLAIGGALGLTGAVLQGYLRNPLADPAVVGVSSSAALGAVAMIVVFSASSPLLIFGAGSIDGDMGALKLLGAFSLLLVAGCPFVAGAAIRMGRS